MGLAEDLKALQDLREKGELSEPAYESARDATMRKYGAAPSGGFQFGRFVGKHLLLILIALVVAVLGVGLWAVSTGNRSTPPARPTYVTQPHSVPITNSALAVAAGSQSWYRFVIPAGVNNVLVNGHFTATGGTGNDIIAYVVDEDGLANLKNGHGAKAYYNSQKVTQATISAILPNVPGAYYLVFDNRFSLITPKAIQVDATLSYLQ